MTTCVMVPDIGWLVDPREEKESVAEERLISGVPRAEVFIHSEKKKINQGRSRISSRLVRYKYQPRSLNLRASPLCQ
jgi:hypothetical protein